MGRASLAGKRLHERHRDPSGIREGSQLVIRVKWDLNWRGSILTLCALEITRWRQEIREVTFGEGGWHRRCWFLSKFESVGKKPVEMKEN